MPPPYDGPLTAQISGWGIARIAGTTSDMNAIARIAMREIGRPSLPGGMPTSVRSIPEQKPRPLPVRIATEQSLSAATSASAA